MVTTKRVVVWAVELIVQAELLIVTMFLIIRPGGHVTVKDFLALSAVVLLYFGALSGYGITTGLSRIFWPDHRLWTYPAFAAALFWIHFELMNGVAGGDLLGSTHDRSIFIMCGMSIAFLTTFLGSVVLEQWNASVRVRVQAL
jgi:hypothetical protein